MILGGAVSELFGNTHGDASDFSAFKLDAEGALLWTWQVKGCVFPPPNGRSNGITAGGRLFALLVADFPPLRRALVRLFTLAPECDFIVCRILVGTKHIALRWQFANPIENEIHSTTVRSAFRGGIISRATAIRLWTNPNQPTPWL